MMEQALNLTAANWISAFGYFAIAAMFIYRTIRHASPFDVVATGVFLTCGVHHVLHPWAMFYGGSVIALLVFDWLMALWAIFGAVHVWSNNGR